MENMENVVMNEEVVATEEVTGTNLGAKILGGAIIAGAIVGVGTLARKGYKWVKSKIQAKKDKKVEPIEGVEYIEIDTTDVQ